MKRIILSWAFVVLVLAGAQAQETGGPEFSFEGPRIVGADLGLTLGSLKLTAGAGYENWEFDRNFLGAPGARLQSWWILDGTLALRQTWALPEADLWTAVGGTGWSSLGQQPTGLFPTDLEGGAFAFVQTGLTRNRYVKGPHGVVEGTRIDALAEVGPGALSITANDYYKLSLRTSALVPLWNLEAPAHLFSGTLGLRANAQWIDGSSVPLLLLEPTEVRGYQRLLDTKLRSVATAELRVGLPSLWGDSDLVPMVFVFAEGGWYAGYSGAPSADAGRTGWLASTGAGFGLAVLGMTTVTVTAALPLADGESAFWWKPNFGLRF